MRSLCGLLKPHLKQPWEVVTGDDADLILVDLDHGAVSEPAGKTPVVGCALRPRMHPLGAIHRPFRASEVLALLSDWSERADLVHVPKDGAGVWDEGRYRLRAWPLEFEQWPAEWRVILAALTRSARSSQDVAQRTGLPQSEVGRCVALLGRQGLLEVVERLGEYTPRPPPAAGRWHGLVAKVGMVLGFGR